MVRTRKRLEEFTPFPRLPLELRTIIWKESSSESRLVEVHVSTFKFKGKDSCTFASTTPVPTILHVNHESRQIGLKQYSLYFGCDDDVIFGGLPTVYFDTEKDVVLYRKADGNGEMGPINDFRFLRRLKRKRGEQEHETLSSLRRVAFMGNPNYIFSEDNIEDTVETLANIPQLSQLLLITKEYPRLGAKDKCSDQSRSCDSCFYGKRSHLEDAVSYSARWVAEAKNLEELFRTYSDKKPEKNRPKPIVSLKLLINVVKFRSKNQ